MSSDLAHEVEQLSLRNNQEQEDEEDLGNQEEAAPGDEAGNDDGGEPNQDEAAPGDEAGNDDGGEPNQDDAAPGDEAGNDDGGNDYYVHIDVLERSSQLVARRINGFMIDQDSYDPRRATNFPTDLMDVGDRGREHTRALRRERGGGHGDQYYEFWKVRRTFDLDGFFEMVENLPGRPHVRLCRIIDNEHEIINLPRVGERR
eukprot:TCONS_00051209-protein